MRTNEANQLEALRSVQAFLDEHQNRLPAIATSGMRRQLDDALARLAQHADDQTSSAAWSRNCTRRYHTARHRLLRSHIVPIALIARTTQPPLSTLEQFRIPHGKPTALQLAAAAHAMAEAAAPHADTFIAAGMPANFLEELERAIDAMMSELAARAQERARHRIATEALRTGIASARRMVQVLDAFVRSECELDAGMIGGWESVTHVRRSTHTAATSPGVSRESMQLIVTDAVHGRGDADGERAMLEHPPLYLRHRMLAMLFTGSRTRVAVGA